MPKIQESSPVNEAEVQYKNIIIQRNRENVITIILNRPDSLNALNADTAKEIVTFMKSLDPKEFNILIFTGSGEKSFCAGADLKERMNQSPEDWRANHKYFREVVHLISNHPCPTIAAVNGVCFGGGFEIALSCDFIYATKKAKFAFSEVKLGIMPGMGGTYHLVQAIGIRKAKEMLYSGRCIRAEEAYNLKLINIMLDSVQDLQKAAEFAASEISLNAPLSVKAIKEAIKTSNNQSQVEGMHNELHCYNPLLYTDDRYEGIKAFFEKRKPRFKAA